MSRDVGRGSSVKVTKLRVQKEDKGSASGSGRMRAGPQGAGPATPSRLGPTAWLDLQEGRGSRNSQASQILPEGDRTPNATW